MATIVFVDDQENIRQLIRATMRESSHRVEVAGDGIEGLEVIRRLRPDLIITDVVMPRLGGFALAATIRADHALRHIPIVFMTASLQPDELDRLRALGGAAHISKPFSPAQLRQVIDALVATSTR